MSILPAAAIPEGSIVLLENQSYTGYEEFKIDHIENSTPRPGRITWRDKNGIEVILGGNDRIEVVKYPHEQE